jgi:hypothetical protein
MKRVILAFLLLGNGFMGAASPPVKVTVQQLLAEPQKFVGKRIDVTGYCHTSNDEVSLAVSKKADEKPSIFTQSFVLQICCRVVLRLGSRRQHIHADSSIRYSSQRVLRAAFWVATLTGMWFFQRWARLIFVILGALVLLSAPFRVHRYSLSASPSFVPIIATVMGLLTGALFAMSFLPPVRDSYAANEA